VRAGRIQNLPSTAVGPDDGKASKEEPISEAATSTEGFSFHRLVAVLSPIRVANVSGFGGNQWIPSLHKYAPQPPKET